MKTAIVTMDYLPDKGGVSVYWSNLYRELPKSKFVLIAPVDSSEYKDEEVEVIRMNFFYKLIWPNWLKLFFSLIFLFKKRNIKQVIAGQVLPIGTVCFLLKQIGIIKSYYISAHGMDLAILKGKKRFLAGMVLRSANKVIVNSPLTKDLTTSFSVSENKIFIVFPCPNVISDSKIDIRKKYKITTSKIILSVSRLVERKGIASVIKSLPLIWKKEPDLVYIIVGAGPDEKRLKGLISEKISSSKQKQIIFAGKVPDNELAAYYKAASVFILPTLNLQGDMEGFGIVNLEAGLFHLPVIATSISVKTKSVISDKTGLIVNFNDFNDIANKIIYLIQNKDKAEILGNNNYNYAKSFSWKKQAELIMKNIL